MKTVQEIDTTTKLCSSCKKKEFLHSFYKHKSYGGGYSSMCKKCSTERTIRWRKNNPEKLKQFFLLI